MAWTKTDDPNDARSVQKLWPLEVTDIDMNRKILKEYMVGKKVAIIVNVASQ